MAIPLRIPLFLLAALVAICAAKSEPSSSSETILGGLQDADIDREDVREAIDYAIRVYNEENNDINYSDVRRVLRAREQVVGGTNYYLDLEIGRTTCTKSQSNLGKCPFIDDKSTLCSFVVNVVPWLHEISVIERNCQNN